MNIRTLPNRLITPFLDFLYPPVCIACNKPIVESKERVCSHCWNAIPIVTQHLPLYRHTRAKLLSEGALHDLVSCFIFEKEGSLQEIIHTLKYKEYMSLGVELGKRIGEKLEEWNLEVDILIPIPLHRIKYRERGFNQSEFIAHGIASVVNRPVVLKAVRRTRNTPTQTKLTIEERRKNMEHAFELILPTSNILSGKKCLLIDDVITTGATTNACAQVIRSAGVTKIIAASVAIAE